MLNTLLSFGFGCDAVVKFPSGFSCSLTIFKFSNPNSVNTLLIGISPEPLIGVYVMLRFFAFSSINSFLKERDLTFSI